MSRLQRPDKAFDLALKLQNTGVTLGQGGGDSGCVQALRNMLRTIGVPGGDLEHDDLFTTGAIVFRHQPRQQDLVIFDRCRAPDLDALGVGIVDQEQLGLWR